MFTKEDVAAVLKKMRTNANMTQKQAAEHLGRKQQTLASWETAQSQPDANTLFMLCELYGTTVNDAFGINPKSRIHDSSPAFAQQFKSTLKKEEMSLSEFVDTFSRPGLLPGITLADATSWSKGYKYPTREQAVILEEAWGLEPGHFSLPADEPEGIKKYRLLTDDSKKTADTVIFKLYDLEQSKPDPFVKVVDRNVFELPYVRSAAAGTGDFILDDIGETLTISVNNVTRKTDYLMLVKGKSMEPRYDDGAIVAVEHAADIGVGECGIFVMSGHRYIKRKGVGGPESINPQYDDVKVGEFDEVRCVGRVLEQIDPEDIISL